MLLLLLAGGGFTVGVKAYGAVAFTLASPATTSTMVLNPATVATGAAFDATTTED